MGGAVEGEAMNERCLPVLVHKLTGGRWVTAGAVPRRGPEDYAVKATAEDLHQSGMCGCLCKSNGENASQSLMRETVGPVDVIFDESGVAESQQNCICRS